MTGIDGLPARLRVAIVEDHPITAAGLGSIIQAAGHDVAVASHVEVFDLSSVADVVVCDLMFDEDTLNREESQPPGRKLLQAGKAVEHLVGGGFRVLAMSGVAPAAAVLETIACGALGFVQKGARPHDFLDGVTRVADGRRYVSPRLAEYLLQDARAVKLDKDEIGAWERSLLDYLRKGDTPDDFAAEKNLRPDKVEEMLGRIFAAAKRRRRLHNPAPKQVELLIAIGCDGLNYNQAAAALGKKVSGIGGALQEIKEKYLRTHDAEEDIAPKTVAQLWVRELGLC